MRFQNPLVFCLMLFIAIFFHKKNASAPSIEQNKTVAYLLTVERGAFHYDCFELSPTMVSYHPSDDAQFELEKYNSFSEVALDSLKTLKLFKQIEEEGFWDLKDVYPETSSDTSQLKITLTANGKTKSVFCEDFDRGCNELMKYIDEKVIELEGNNLKRIYLPG